MKNIIFNNLVKNNGIIIKVNSNNEKLQSKEQFIDDMLQRETTIKQAILDGTLKPVINPQKLEMKEFSTFFKKP